MSDSGVQLDPMYQIVGVVGAHVAPIFFGSFGFRPLAFLSPSAWGDENEGSFSLVEAARIGSALRVVVIGFPGDLVALGSDLPTRPTVGDVFGARLDATRPVPAGELDALIGWKFDFRGGTHGSAYQLRQQFGHRPLSVASLRPLREVSCIYPPDRYASRRRRAPDNRRRPNHRSTRQERDTGGFERTAHRVGVVRDRRPVAALEISDGRWCHVRGSR